MSLIKAKARLLRRNNLTDNVMEFLFQMVKPIVLDFLAGQYISVEVGSNMKRSYSIASSPLKSRRQFKIILDTRPNGIGTQYLLNLNEGGNIKFIGQIGKFILPKELSNELYFIGTGTGISPLKSMIETLVLSKKCKSHDIHVYFGTRTANDVFYKNIFEKYLLEGEVKSYKIYLSRERYCPSYAVKGYVSQFIKQESYNKLMNGQFFLCGNSEMIDSVKKDLLSMKVKEANIYHEKFY